MSWAGPEDLFLSTSLATYLDRKLLVLLRDGRKLLGTLRSFDQYANAVLEGAYERVIVGDLYSDIPLGLYVIRGENVVLIGEVDVEKEDLPPHMKRVSSAEIARLDCRRARNTFIRMGFVYRRRARNTFLMGFVYCIESSLVLKYV
ncbi:Sm-like protein lsm1b [Dionaea muscipula]